MEKDLDPAGDFGTRYSIFFCGEFSVHKSTFLRYQALAPVSVVESGADAITRAVAANTPVSMALNMQGGVVGSNHQDWYNCCRKAGVVEPLLPGIRYTEYQDCLRTFIRGRSLYIPDYNLSGREVYTSVVNRYIKKYDNIDILGNSG